jgi:hypothetical protein
VSICLIFTNHHRNTPTEVREIVLSYLTIDIEIEIRFVHQSHGRYQIDTNKKLVQRPKDMGKDFLADFLATYVGLAHSSSRT